MSAWGVEPRDSDTALNHELHIFGCEDRDDLGPQNPDEQRYIAWLVTQLKPDFPDLKGLAALSLTRMRALLDNEAWLEEWGDEAIVTAIEEQIVKLNQV